MWFWNKKERFYLHQLGVLNGSIKRSGVYVGMPEIWIKAYSGKLSGVPLR